MNSTIIKLLVLVLALHAATSFEIEETHDISHEFCWKDSYGRGVGTIPTQCGKKTKIGLLCYSHCPSGYSRFGFDCHQNCLSGWRNDGLFCRLAEYGRGGGYPWKFGDWFNDKGMYKRCEKDHGRGKCQKWGAIVYPKCKSGFSAFGCCICRPSPTPNCKKLGFNGGLDLSCAKKIIIGDPTGMDCSSNLQYDAGLCYKKCKTGFYGVGPVCWANAPKGWVGCGMGAAKTSKICKDTIVGQITSVGEMALNIATTVASFGSSAAATTAAKSAANAGKIAKIKETMSKIKKIIESNKTVKKLISKAKEIKDKTKTLTKDIKKIKEKYDKAEEQYQQAKNIVDTANKVATEDYSNYTPADYARLAASVAALADPTGIASVIENYSHPKCSTIFK